jgi:ribosome maturation factor RimP
MLDMSKLTKVIEEKVKEAVSTAKISIETIEFQEGDALIIGIDGSKIGGLTMENMNHISETIIRQIKEKKPIVFDYNLISEIKILKNFNAESNKVIVEEASNEL